MTQEPFALGGEGRLVIVRLLLGFTAIGLCQLHQLAMTSILLVLTVWLDAATGWYFRKRVAKTSAVIALECYADFVCFVGAPIALTTALSLSYLPIIILPIFLTAAVYRLARFQVEGLVKGRYSGLPVTYNGYLFPLAALAIHFYPSSAIMVLSFLLLASSALMVSRRFTIPEV